MLRVQILYHFMWVTVPMSFKFSKPWLSAFSTILYICYAGVSQGLVLKWILKCFFIHFQFFVQLVWSWIGNNGFCRSLSHLKNALYINLISALIGTEIRLILQSDTYESFPANFIKWAKNIISYMLPIPFFDIYHSYFLYDNLYGLH